MPLDVGTRCALVPIELINRFTDVLKEEAPEDLASFIRKFLQLMHELGQCEVVQIDKAEPLNIDTSTIEEEAE